MAILADGAEGRVTAGGFAVSELAVGRAEPGDVLVIEANGRMHPCRRASDPRVAGVLVRRGDRLAGGLRWRGEVAAAGPVLCRADAGFGAIRSGDLLTTSRVRGHAMGVRDRSRSMGTVLGKALEPLCQGRGLIRVLLALQ